ADERGLQSAAVAPPLLTASCAATSRSDRPPRIARPSPRAGEPDRVLPWLEEAFELLLRPLCGGYVRSRMGRVLCPVGDSVDDRRPVVPSCLRDGGRKVVECGHAAAPGAKGRGRGRKIDGAVPHAVLLVPALPLGDLDQAQRVVIVDDGDESNMVAHAGFEV